MDVRPVPALETTFNNVRLPSHDPEMAKLVEDDQQMSRETVDLAASCRKEADTAKRAELRKSLQELVGKHFDLRQQARELQIARLEAELKKIRDKVQKRNDARELIVDRHVALLLKEEDELAFPPPPSTGQYPTRGPTTTFPFGPSQPVPDTIPTPQPPLGPPSEAPPGAFAPTLDDPATLP
ncbi:MAG: hypothetical protein ACYTG0_02195 [Planctomycetota bacterium]|jgi:hypothetical protein